VRRGDVLISSASEQGERDSGTYNDIDSTVAELVTADCQRAVLIIAVGGRRLGFPLRGSTVAELVGDQTANGTVETT